MYYLDNFRYFENLALVILDKLYAEDRNEAYRNLVALGPRKLGRSLTPMQIAYDSWATKFLSHACCQTLLNLIWMNSMDLDTPAYKLFPCVSLFFIHWIKFQTDALKYAQNSGSGETDDSNSGKLIVSFLSKV